MEEELPAAAASGKVEPPSTAGEMLMGRCSIGEAELEEDPERAASELDEEAVRVLGSEYGGWLKSAGGRGDPRRGDTRRRD
jgi:hypothetical protein